MKNQPYGGNEKAVVLVFLGEEVESNAPFHVKIVLRCDLGHVILVAWQRDRDNLHPCHPPTATIFPGSPACAASFVSIRCQCVLVRPSSVRAGGWFDGLIAMVWAMCSRGDESQRLVRQRSLHTWCRFRRSPARWFRAVDAIGSRASGGRWHAQRNLRGDLGTVGR